MKILVLASEPVSPAALRAALPDDVDPGQAEVMVVAPALQKSALRFWLSDPDDAISRADEVGRETLEGLDEGGIAATADTGESDPEVAIGDALKTFPADRILLFAHGETESRFREQVDIEAIEHRFGVPVGHGDL